MAEETKIAMKLEEEAKPIKKMCEKLTDIISYELNKDIEKINTKELSEAIDMIKDLYEAKKEMYEACYYKQIMEAMEESEYGEDYDEYGPMESEMRRGYRGQPRSKTSGRFMSRGDGRRSNGRRGYESPTPYTMTPEMYHMYPAEYYRDMDREEMGRMYYTEGGSTGNQSTTMSGNQSSGGSSGGSRGYSENNGGQYSSRMQMQDGQQGDNTRGYEDGYTRGYEEGSRNNRRDGREGRSGQSRRGYMEAKEQGKDKQSKMKELEEYMKSMAEDLTEAIEGATPEERTMAKNKLSVLVQKM